MTDPSKLQNWAREELLGLLSVSGTLAGLCVTIVALINAANKGASTLVDDMLAVCAAAFVSCIYLIFWALKTVSPKRAARVIRIADMLFLSALSVMTLAGFIMVYTIW